MKVQECAGLALSCDRSGTIKAVVRNTSVVPGTVQPGTSFLSLLEPNSLAKAAEFLRQVAVDGAAFDWEMNFAGPAGIVPLQVAGLASESGLFLVAAPSRNDVHGLCEDLMRINNEHVNALRATIKDRLLEDRGRASRDNEMMEEMSRLNNELVTLQRELTRKNVQLETLNEQKNLLLGMAAHDLRNPLGVVLAYTKFLLSESQGPLDERQKLFLSRIGASTDFMLRMVEDLLDLSQIESGKLRLELETADLVILVRENLVLNTVFAEDKGISLRPDLPSSPHPARVDRRKLEQVLNNLVSNALKFSPRGSAVQVSLHAAQETVRISVSDEGPGIPLDEQDRLFKPFSLLSVSSTAGEKSTGLGLAIVRRIVEGHGGRVWAESEVGRGTTFVVELPAAAP